MKFTELTVKEFENFVQNPSLESHYFQVKENIARESDGFQVVLLGVKDDDNRVIAASLFSKILQWAVMCIIPIEAL